MNRRQNKIIIFIMVVALTAGLFSTAGLSMPREVRMWTYSPGNYKEWKARKPQIEKKFDITLNILLVDQEYFVLNLRNAMDLGNGYPDIIDWVCENNWIMSTNPNKSLLAPLEQFTARSAVFPDVSPGKVSFVTYDSHIYGLPRYAHPTVLVYNDTLWKSVGIDLAEIVTWDDFFAAAQKLCPPRSDRYALSGSGTLYVLLQQAGVHILTESGEPNLTNPDFQELIKRWYEWIATRTIYKGDWEDFKTMLIDGSLAAYPSSDMTIPMVFNTPRAGNYKFKARPLPLYPGSDCPTATWGGSFLGIVKLAKDQEQLYQIIEYMQYDKKAAIDSFRDTGLLPSLSTVWNDPIFQKPNPNFGNQKLAKLQVDMARQIPSLIMGDIFWFAVEDYDEEAWKIRDGLKTIDEACKTAQQKAMEHLPQEPEEPLPLSGTNGQYPASAIVSNNHGEAYRKAGDYPKAIAYFNHAIKINPKFAEAYHNRGYVYYQLKKYQSALADFTKAIQITPNHARSYYYRGMVNFYLKKFVRAVGDYTKAIQLKSTETTIYHYRGIAYYQLKEYPAALADFDKAKQNNANDAESYYYHGLTCHQRQQLQTALADFDKVIKLNPKYAEAYMFRGMIHDQLGKYQKAFEDYNQAIQLNLNRAEIYYYRGNAYYRLKEYHKAIEDYDQAIDLNRNYAEAYYNRGNAYFETQDFLKAKDDYQEVILLNPAFPEVTNNLESVNQQLCLKKIADYTDIIRQNPNKAKNYYSRGLAYVQVKEYSKAIEDFTQAIKINPYYADAYRNRGDLYKQLGDHQKAVMDYSILYCFKPFDNGFFNEIYPLYKLSIQECTDIIQKDPSNAEVYYHRGVARYQLSRYEDAAADFDQAIRLKLNTMEVYFYRGITFHFFNNYPKAIADLTESIKLSPGNAWAYYYRGLSYQASDKKTKAVKDLSQARLIFVRWGDGDKAAECSDRMEELQ